MKHCTTDKCPQILDSSCVFYEGTSLIFSGINTNDSVETVIQKLNLKLESLPIFNSNNYYTILEVNNIVKNYIPLSGTLSQFPVIGNIEFSTDYDTKLFSGDAEIKLHEGYLELNSTNNNSVAINPSQVFINSGLFNNLKYINLANELDYIPVKSNVNGAGLVGTNYYGNNYVDNSFVQKKFVTDTFNNIDLSNYYTKNETYSQTEINGFLSGKQNTIGYTPENSANKSDSYTASSSTTYASTKALVDGLATKLDKGGYEGTAQDLKNAIDGKASLSHTHNISDINNLQTSLNNKQDILQSVTGNVGVGKTDVTATEKLDVNGNVKAISFIKSGGTSTQVLMADGNVIEKSDFYQVNNGGVSNQNLLLPNGNQTLSIANTSTNFDGDLSNITFEGTFANFNGSSNSNKSLGFTLAAPTSINQGIYYKTWYSASTTWRRLWDTSNFSQSNINNWNTAHGWGNHASAGYALATGTNATNNWSNTSSGLSINPTVTGKTLNASGQTVTLRDATYGQISGIVQEATNGPIVNDWYNKLKTLHNNSAGYFTELAQSFTGTEGVWHRRNSAGTISTWKRLYDDSIWNSATMSYSGSTLTLTINGISKTATINAGSAYTAGTNISISSNQISVVDSPTFTGSVTATAFYESSLRELKENILPFELSGLGLLSQLEIVTYDRIDKSSVNKIGIIADDSPEEFLSEDKDAVDLYKTVFIQAKAIQELNAKNLELEERLIKLEKLLSNA